MQTTNCRVLMLGVTLLAGPALGATPATTLVTPQPAPPPMGSQKGALAVTDLRHEDNAREMSEGRLEGIQSETVLFEAQLARAKAWKELQSNGYDTALSGPFNPASPAQDKTTKDVRPATASTVLPQVVEVSGTGKALAATLVLENGNQIRVQTGNPIPGTPWVVASITFNNVTVRGNDGALTSLAFSG
ncbi:type IV pilus biogenesis protein PilP [Rahnella sp. BCC 1045]|uniref:type IV pilus biogenesis protein PilP n=1 Tax=Rahnella sp. BCC 1045 TaxID=2816251 RepID=UPI001C258974|nr:type IV pilus biogenesis protein PilP [Rahnella sp. BCC 1045]MBU9819681.1 type IV pilus biogenesis protein PilP [Rahnella sp. BCC 1045]